MQLSWYAWWLETAWDRKLCWTQMASAIATNIVDTVMNQFRIKMRKGVAPQGWFWDESVRCTSRPGDSSEILLPELRSALTAGMRLMSPCRSCPASHCSELTFSLLFTLGKKKQTAARVCLGLSSFWPRNIKTWSLNSERFRDQYRYDLGKSKLNKIKFSTSVWYLLLSECQKPTRLTHMNIFTDSGSKEHCPAASQGKHISWEIRNECLWGRRGKETSQK